MAKKSGGRGGQLTVKGPAPAGSLPIHSLIFLPFTCAHARMYHFTPKDNRHGTYSSAPLESRKTAGPSKR